MSTSLKLEAWTVSCNLFAGVIRIDFGLCFLFLLDSNFITRWAGRVWMEGKRIKTNRTKVFWLNQSKLQQ